MLLRAPVRALLAATAIALAIPAGAGAQGEQQPLLGVNVNDSVVDLAIIVPKGSHVEFSEIVDGQTVRLGTDVAVNTTGGPAGVAKLMRAVQWRCDRLVRQFVATAQTPDGRLLQAFNEARTPSCYNRLAINVPAQVKRGGRLRVGLRDRWQLGDVSAEVCVTRSHAGWRCRKLVFAPGQQVVATTRRVSAKRGLLKVAVTVAGLRIYRHVGVGIKVPRESLPTMLATGDSMIQGIDAELADRLRSEYRVVRHTRPATGVSKNLDTPWTTVARQQVRAHRPAVTVVFVGATDSFDMVARTGQTVVCCGLAWKEEYLRRITDMARTYSQRDRSRVLWVVLPPPRDERMMAAIAAVNETIFELAARMPSVTLVRLDRVFGPLYSDSIDGQIVRDPDGLHLSVAGEKLAAEAIIAADRGKKLQTT